MVDKKTVIRKMAETGSALNLQKRRSEEKDDPAILSLSKAMNVRQMNI